MTSRPQTSTAPATTPVTSLPLARLLAHAADAVQAVRAGQSLNEALARCPADARPGTQALSFHALRWLGSAQAVRALLAPKAPPPAVDALLLTALALLWPAAEAPYAAHTLVDQAVEAARRRAKASASFVNAVLRRFLREQEATVAAALRDPVARFNHPAWWIDRLKHDWPERWQALLDADNQHPPMTLRVNARRGAGRAGVADEAAGALTAANAADALSAANAAGAANVLAAAAAADAGLAGRPARASAAAYVARLAEQGISAIAAGPQAVVLERPRPVTQLPGFAQGDVSVQDASAQRAAPLLIGAGLPVGARVLDACAAPGGKTAHLLELADLDVLALDRDAGRLTRVTETLARIGLTARTLAADAGDTAAWWDGRPFDAILLDAPCSASGIVRRHPDVRWLRRASDIPALAKIQADLLDALWPLLAPGGRLLYCTCSVFKAEGQHQIDAFLQRHADARVPADPASPGHLLPLPDNEAESAAPAFGAPPDGFFYGLLQKT